MSSPLNNAASNALRIAGELYPAGGFEAFLCEPSAPMFSKVVFAAAVLAHIEAEPGFAWNETTANDWESVCASIARTIQAGRHPHRAFILQAVGLRMEKKDPADKTLELRAALELARENIRALSTMRPNRTRTSYAKNAAANIAQALRS